MDERKGEKEWIIVTLMREEGALKDGEEKIKRKSFDKTINKQEKNC